MPTYQFLLHTTGILLEDEDGQYPLIGFYSSRRARADSQGQAYDAVMSAMDRDPKIRNLIQSGHDAELRPKTVVEEVHKIGWWRALLPWREPGLSLYGSDDDDTSPE